MSTNDHMGFLCSDVTGTAKETVLERGNRTFADVNRQGKCGAIGTSRKECEHRPFYGFWFEEQQRTKKDAENIRCRSQNAAPSTNLNMNTFH